MSCLGRSAGKEIRKRVVAERGWRWRHRRRGLGGRFALGVGFLEIGFEFVEALFPEAAMVFEPVHDRAQDLRLESAEPHAAAFLAGDDRGILEHAQVLGHRGQGHAEGRGEIPDRVVATVGEHRHDAAAGPVAEGGEEGVEALIVVMVNHMV